MSIFSPWPVRNFLVSHPEQLRCLRRTLCATSSRLKVADDANGSSTTKPADAKKPDAKDQPLAPLSRPLGVRQRPTIVMKTRTEKMKDLMDQEARMAQRRHLIKEAGKGYFHDMNMTRKHGGKTWIAPRVLIREDKALYLPNIVGKSLDEGIKKDTTTMCFGRITILAMLGTQISEVHAKGFAEATHTRYSSNPLYQYVQINLQENLLKSFLVKLFSNSLRSTVPPELQSNYLVSSQNMEYVREPLGMTNSKVGYVYLIDENLKIRWGGCADATSKEAQALESCTGVLLKRLEDMEKEKSSAPAEAVMGDPPAASPQSEAPKLG
ncbi:ATP10 protein-domain-containing protein [Crassisporium funariophilum]|nr:ATP10 protein-domain-containing protein [Crassisporium funariophilum]